MRFPSTSPGPAHKKKKHRKRKEAEMPELKGIITSIRRFDKGSRLLVSEKQVYIDRAVPDFFLGMYVLLKGEWKKSPKSGKYFFADALDAVEPPVKEDIVIRLMGRRGAIDENIERNISILKATLEVLVDTGKKALAKKIVTFPIKKALRIQEDPYILYFKKMISSETAEIIAQKSLLDLEDHTGRINAAVTEILKRSYDDGKNSIPLSVLEDNLRDFGIKDIDFQRIKKSAAVFDSGFAYIPKVYFLRKRTLELLNNNAPTLDFHVDKRIESLLSHRYVILTGPAGSGKTTLLKELKYLGGFNVVLTALTGKAASVLGDNAQTLHSLLGYGNGGFKVKELPHDIIVVDEASMLDWHTAYALFKAAKGHVILSGDPEQLEPVRGGSVFKELLDVLEVVEFDKVYRFTSGSPNVSVIKRKNISELVSTVVALAVSMKRKREDFQVLTPVKGNIIGTHNLNHTLQEHLNYSGLQIDDKFRVGDRVIVTKNCYNKEVTAYNGQVGYITDIDDYNIYVKLNNGVTLPFRPDEIELAYALTVHKAQGSQWDKVIFVSPEPMYGDFIDERMRHTGLTRGRSETFVVTML